MCFAEDSVKLNCNGEVGAESGYNCSLIHNDPDLLSETHNYKPRRNRSIQLQVSINLKRNASAISESKGDLIEGSDTGCAGSQVDI